jgi:hypothetical protein
MKKGSEWFKLLSEKEQIKYESQCNYFKDVIDSDYKTFEDFIDFPLTWECTNEGFKYWEKISKRKL